MNRHERRAWFDRLVELRNAYLHLGPEDTTVVLSIDAALGLAAGPALEAAESEADSGWG